MPPPRRRAPVYAIETWDNAPGQKTGGTWSPVVSGQVQGVTGRTLVVDKLVRVPTDLRPPVARALRTRQSGVRPSGWNRSRMCDRARKAGEKQNVKGYNVNHLAGPSFPKAWRISSPYGGEAPRVPGRPQSGGMGVGVWGLSSTPTSVRRARMCADEK